MESWKTDNFEGDSAQDYLLDLERGYSADLMEHYSTDLQHEAESIVH